MIGRIGVICQDRISLGFLHGLRDRLRCEAEFIEAPSRLCRSGKEQRLRRKDASAVWRYFRSKQADLVVRFTDADRSRWQDVYRDEMRIFPDEARALFICGVAVNNPEDWLCLNPQHLSQVLGVAESELRDESRRTDRIKRALTKLARGQKGQSEVVAELVRNAPHEVFHRWLQADEALRSFYSDCRRAAAADHCETPNELDASE